MTTAAIIAAGEARAAHVATQPRTQLIRGVDMDEAITWGPEREHDGSPNCPADARDVPCMITDIRFGLIEAPLRGNYIAWQHVTAYRLPADVPSPADPVRDALVEALQGAKRSIEDLLSVMATPDQRQCCDGIDCGCFGATVYQEAEHYAREDVKAIDAALALAKGEKP